MEKYLINIDASVVASTDQISTEIGGGEQVILQRKSGIYYSLDSFGAVIWNRIQTRQTVKDLHAAILNEYDVESDRCKKDLLAFLDELAGQGLLDTD